MDNWMYGDVKYSIKCDLCGKTRGEHITHKYKNCQITHCPDENGLPIFNSFFTYQNKQRGPRYFTGNTSDISDNLNCDVCGKRAGDHYHINFNIKAFNCVTDEGLRDKARYLVCNGFIFAPHSPFETFKTSNVIKEEEIPDWKIIRDHGALDHECSICRIPLQQCIYHR